MKRTYPFNTCDDLQLHPEYQRLRREQPVVRVAFPQGGEGWLATSYDTVKAVLTDARFSRAATVGQDVPRMMANPSSPGSLLSMDAPEHTRLRRLVGRTFTVRRVEGLRPRAQEITDELVDRLGNPAELVEGLALPLPIMMICELLGVPFADRADFRRWSEQLVACGPDAAENAALAMQHMMGFISGLVDQRLGTPTDDLLGELVRVSEDGDHLTRDELVIMGVTLLVAGHETTVSQIGNAILTLVQNPDQLAVLRAEPELLPGAVDELLRYIPLGVGAGFPRVAVEDVELGGVTVKAGDAVLVSVGSANRDEAVYPGGERLDLRRDAARHLAFGQGIHYCLGAQLARMELKVALGTLLRRFPKWELAAPVEFRQDTLVRGLRRLCVAW